MPELPGNSQLPNFLDGKSMYKMRGSDKVILRTKGGPTKNQVKHSPKFDVTRRNNREFGGRARMAQRIRKVLLPLQSLADRNFTGPLNALVMHIQELDNHNEKGKRDIFLTREPEILAGFNLNNQYDFDEMVQSEVSYLLSKDSLKATIHIPALQAGVNFFPVKAHQWYRIITVIGTVPDLEFAPNGYVPVGDDELPVECHATEWYNTSEGSPVMERSLVIKDKPKTTAYSCVLGIGIAMGNLQYGRITEEKYVGSAKVLAVH